MSFMKAKPSTEQKGSFMTVRSDPKPNQMTVRTKEMMGPDYVAPVEVTTNAEQNQTQPQFVINSEINMNFERDRLLLDETKKSLKGTSVNWIRGSVLAVLMDGVILKSVEDSSIIYFRLDQSQKVIEYSSIKNIEAIPLTLEEYHSYGRVIEVGSVKFDMANQGTAQRFNWLASLENLRPDKAKLNICVFKCQPRNLPFDINLLEKHPYSTQMFVPMTAEKRYLVIVAKGEEIPDISTLKCFIAKKGQAITYHPGIWHHPMVALDKETDFCCFVYEDGTKNDCVVELLKKTIRCTSKL